MPNDSDHIAQKLPKGLRKAVEEHRCIVFVGAGASMDAVDIQNRALPHWRQMLAELLDLIQDSPSEDPPDVVAEIREMFNRGETDDDHRGVD